MPIQAKCPNCDRILEYQDNAEGALARCAGCRTVFIVRKTDKPVTTAATVCQPTQAKKGGVIQESEKTTPDFFSFLAADIPGILQGLVVMPLFMIPVAPFVWLVAVAVRACPMTWGGLLFNWLLIAVMWDIYFVYRKIKSNWFLYQQFVCESARREVEVINSATEEIRLAKESGVPDVSMHMKRVENAFKKTMSMIRLISDPNMKGGMLLFLEDAGKRFGAELEKE
jgi:hypothetical protein